MTINLDTIKNEIPGLTESISSHLYEACVVCLTRQNHISKETQLKVIGDNTKEFTIEWKDIFNEQIDRAWKDQFYTTEHGAICLVIIYTIENSEYTIIERSARKNGFDYWLGEKDDILFQQKARLEISGIFKGDESALNKRYKTKLTQTDSSDNLKIPAIIGVVEFSKPILKYGFKNG
jgi:hypothetical protein